MTEIAFILNGTPLSVAAEPTRTLLDFLREDRGLTGTKEGCNEGDCGACTVMVTDETGPRALNACLLFLPQLQGKGGPDCRGPRRARRPPPSGATGADRPSRLAMRLLHPGLRHVDGRGPCHRLPRP